MALKILKFAWRAFIRQHQIFYSLQILIYVHIIDDVTGAAS